MSCRVRFAKLVTANACERQENRVIGRVKCYKRLCCRFVLTPYEESRRALHAPWLTIPLQRDYTSTTLRTICNHAGNRFHLAIDTINVSELDLAIRRRDTIGGLRISHGRIAEAAAT